jgi:hypothetical protein
MEFRIIAMAMLLFFAIFFLGVGMTGFAVFSETCGDSVPCNDYNQQNETMNWTNTIAGLGLIVAAGLVYKYGKSSKKRRR